MNIKLSLPDGFLDEEIRQGHLVTKEAKKIWAVELDLLNQFITVCKKYNIQYFAESGTLLGAVRHGGYIPWDDDIDVIMVREEYEKLCSIAEREFQYPYFFQTEFTDPGTVRGHAQLRNSETTGILRAECMSKYTFNQGIFMDIFVMDRLPPANLRDEYFHKIWVFKNKAYRFAMDNHRAGNMSQENLYYRELENVCSEFNQNKNAVKMGAVSYTISRADMIRNVRDYDQAIEVNFEFMKIAIPYRYKDVLMSTYGIWRKPIIRTAKSQGHGSVIYDTDISYKEYWRREQKGDSND